MSWTPAVVVVTVTAAGPVGLDVEARDRMWFSRLLTGTPTEMDWERATAEAVGTARGTRCSYRRALLARSTYGPRAATPSVPSWR